MKREVGSAMVEFAATAPLMVLIVLLIVQFASVFHRSLMALAGAEAEAAANIISWEGVHLRRGFSRPCLNCMPHRSARRASEVEVGMGRWKKRIDTSQEVRIVDGTICENCPD